MVHDVVCYCGSRITTDWMLLLLLKQKPQSSNGLKLVENKIHNRNFHNFHTKLRKNTTDKNMVRKRQITLTTAATQ